jgi:hypothetical protein
MRNSTRARLGLAAAALALLAVQSAFSPSVMAQAKGPAKATAEPVAAPAAPVPTGGATRMEAFKGTWVEGGGYDITYGKDYDTCAKRCMAASKCVMIEYYRPEKKCNLYDSVRKQLKGGSSVVAVKR